MESFADICLFDLVDEESERLFVTASAHRDPSKESALAAVSNILYVEERGVHPVVQVSRSGVPFFLPHVDEAIIIAHAASRQHEDYMRRFGYRSKIVAPVVAQGRIFGALTFVRTDEENEFDPEDLAFAIELGRRAGLAVANAKQYHREQYVAETLQRSFLPSSFPQNEDVQFSAFYRPGSTDAAVGGDWYDAFERPNGDIAVTIGDVTGKGIDAARLMVLIRQAIRVAALDKGRPGEILDTCSRLLINEKRERLASAFVGVLSPDGKQLRYASAGHAPPLLRLADGTIEQLELPSAPLGAIVGASFDDYSLELPRKSMLVLYTDGIIEASRDAIEGEEMLRDLLRPDAVRHAANPAEFIERAAAQHAVRDDIAIMVVSVGTKEMRWQFQANDARAAYTMRTEFLNIVERHCHADEAQVATCGLIFSEVVGNAVRHAPGSLSVSLEIRKSGLVLHVIDAGPGFEFQPSLPEDIWSEGGRGLFLVSTLGRETKVERLPGKGTHVSVTLPVKCK